jgi:hypothetical protein
MRQQLICAFVAGFSVIAVRASGDLVGHWTLDNGSTGVQNQGTNGALSDLNAVSTSDDLNIMTLPTFHATGGFDGGGYASFDGVSQGLTTFQAGNAAQALSNYPFTMAAWIRPTGQVGDPRATAFSLTRTASASQYYRMGMGYSSAVDEPNPGDFEAVRANSTITQVDAVDTFSSLTDGSWHHAAVVFAATDQVQIYLDGTLVIVTDPTTPATVTFQNLVNALNLGLVYRNIGTGGFIDWWKGDIDDPRLYNTGLTAQEVAALVNPPGPGDFDIDGDVDGADFAAWQMHFPQGSEAMLSEGDADGDGDVDGADFIVWQTNVSPSPGPSTSPVPEPPTLLLLMIVSLTFAASCGLRMNRQRYMVKCTNR